MYRFSVILLSIPLIGCASGNAPESRDTGLPTVDTGFDTDDTGETRTLEGDFMALTGTIEFVAGEPVATDIAVEVQASDAEGTLSVVDCGATLVGEPVATEPPDDEVVLFGMWRYDVEPGLCPDLPNAFEVGLGPLLPTLWPQLEEAGASLRHSRGLYTPNTDRDGLWVFGYAGTPEQLDGIGLPASLQPLPDGVYTIESAYLLPL